MLAKVHCCFLLKKTYLCVLIRALIIFQPIFKQCFTLLAKVHCCLHVTQVSTGGFVAEERAVEIEKFFSENPWPMAGRVVKQNCEAIRLNARWLQRDREAVKEWLASQ